MPDKYSSEQFSEGRLRIHGSYTIRSEGEFFIVDTEGPFNLESVQAIGQARLAAMTEWETGEPQAWITIFNSNMLMPLEAVTAFSGHLEKILNSPKSIAAIAWVAAPEVEGRAVMLTIFSRIFAKSSVPWQVFEDLESARSWGQAELNASRIS